MNAAALPEFRTPIGREEEAIPRSKEAAAEMFKCESLRCRMSGAACAGACHRSQLAPMSSASAGVCAVCPAGRARMRLLNIGRSVDRATVDAARQSTGHNAADGACARCLARPATGTAQLYSAFCTPCINEGRRQFHSPKPWGGEAKTKAHAILAWLQSTVPGDGAPKPEPVPRKPRGTNGGGKMLQRTEPCAKCGGECEPRMKRRANPGLCFDCHRKKENHARWLADKAKRDARKWVVSAAKCARCPMPCGRRLKTRANPDLCSACHRAVTDAARSSAYQKAKRKKVAA